MCGHQQMIGLMVRIQTLLLPMDTIINGEIIFDLNYDELLEARQQTHLTHLIHYHILRQHFVNFIEGGQRIICGDEIEHKRREGDHVQKIGMFQQMKNG